MRSNAVAISALRPIKWLGGAGLPIMKGFGGMAIVILLGLAYLGLYKVKLL